MGFFNRFKIKRVTNDWKMVWVGSDWSKAEVYGVYINDYPWEDLHETVSVIEPRYHQTLTAHKYEVEIDGQKKVFATLEYSMCIYMYFIPLN